MSLLTDYLIYKFNDMSYVFYEATARGLSNTVAWSFDFVSNYLTKTFLTVFGIVMGVNLLAISYTLLNLLFSYLLFNKLNKNKVFAGIFSLLYALSIYFVFRVISFTPNLYPIFIFPLSLYLLLQKTKPVYMGILNFFFLCLSSYYAFFNLIVITLWYLLDKKVKSVVVFSIPLVIGAVLFFLPYLKQNSYLSSYTNTSATTVYRPIEDWYNFSFRPWYFIVPPGSSLFFGNLHNAFYDKIKSTGNYFTQNYSEDEMAGAYMGWHFVLGAVGVFYLAVVKRKFGTDDEQKLIKKCFWLILAILLISGPPSFNVAGLKLYTPSYLLYYIIPVFRSLTRWSAVIYLLVLIINYYLVLKLYSRVDKKYLRALFILTFVALNFVIFAIKIPVINVKKPPQDVIALKNLDGRSLVFYPEADYYNLFWSQVFNKEIINPRNIAVLDQPPKEFSTSLLTDKHIDLFLESDTRYLIYNKTKSPDAEASLTKLYGQPKEVGNGFFVYSIR